MPLFMFECADCHVRAETLVAGADIEMHCPDCGSAEVSKLPSTFAPLAAAGSTAPAPVDCGASNCCMGQGGCALN